MHREEDLGITSELTMLWEILSRCTNDLTSQVYVGVHKGRSEQLRFMCFRNVTPTLSVRP